MNHEQFNKAEILEALKYLYTEMASRFDYGELAKNERQAMSMAERILSCELEGYPRKQFWISQWDAGDKYATLACEAGTMARQT